jgi:hypothetical protein
VWLQFGKTVQPVGVSVFASGLWRRVRAKTPPGVQAMVRKLERGRVELSRHVEVPTARLFRFVRGILLLRVGLGQVALKSDEYSGFRGFSVLFSVNCKETR